MAPSAWLPRFLLVILCSFRLALADFGDFEDLSFQCPVRVTCPVICVSTEAFEQDVCEVIASCENGQFLCQDGHCRESCVGSPPNPCKNACAPKACPRVTAQRDHEDTCYLLYKDYYDAADICNEQEKDQLLNSVKFREGLFVMVFIWWIAVTLGVVGWCYYNQVYNAVPNSTVRISDALTQTGYKEHMLGTALYISVVATMWGVQFILAYLTVLYYVNQGKITFVQSIWTDERQILQTFEVFWCLGIVWCLVMKWPVRLRSLFWRRCHPSEATHISVWTRNEKLHGFVVSGDRYISYLRKFVSLLLIRLNFLLSIFFAEDRTKQTTGTFTFCEVARELDGSRYFEHNFRRYNLVGNEYVAGEWSPANTVAELHDQRNGLSSADVVKRTTVVGPNIIPMRPPSFLRVFVEEFTKPYYTYQNFILWTWMPLFYYYMSVVHAFVIFVGGLTVCFFRLRNEQSLFQLTFMDGSIEVQRDGKYVRIPQADLVPGDLVIIDPGLTYCDMVLISGTGVLVDESALTGESTPIAKTPLDPSEGNVLFTRNGRHNKRHIIQAGCAVLESEHRHNTAIVIGTGSFTAKGELLREIFSYQRHQFKFDVEVPIVLFVLFLYAIACFIAVFFLLNYTPTYGWFYGMYAVANVIPPLLPTVFTVSVGLSSNRLAEKRVACTNSEEILVAGKVKRAFFDKTGTLTRQGLEFVSSRSSSSWESGDLSDEMIHSMATCHSLTRSKNGMLVGNPVDKTMFEASGATFHASTLICDSKGRESQIIKHFDFDHHRMTQSVLIRSQGEVIAYVKGSGESVSALCKSSTLPASFDRLLRDSARAGVYQLSFAKKILPSLTAENIAKLSRDDIETDLDFIGVVNFKNVIRDSTPSVISELENGEVKCVMVTGDNTLTGIRIAKEAGIIFSGRSVLYGSKLDDAGEIVWIDEDDKEASLPSDVSRSGMDLAVTGSIWEHLKTKDPQMAARLAECIRVYGRCTPAHKVSVVTHFIDYGYITLMAGDGGNDAGALKTAHVGVALSDTEASIVSPFTSLDKKIDSVLDVLKEGRCALASALSSYKYMVLYGQISAMTNIINSSFHAQYSEWCWVFIDGIWSIGFAFTLSLAKPALSLAPSRPTSSLLGAHTLSSTVGILFIHFFFTWMTLLILFNQDWYDCRQWNNDDISNVVVIGDNYEAETMFLITGYQFILTGMVYNFGYEFRASWFDNRFLVAAFLGFSFIHFYITLVPGYLSCLFRVNCDNEHVLPSVTLWEDFPIQNEWSSTIMPFSYRVTLLVMMILNAVSAVLWDYYVVNGTRRRYAYKRREGKNVDNMVGGDLELKAVGGDGSGPV